VGVLWKFATPALMAGYGLIVPTVAKRTLAQGSHVEAGSRGKPRHLSSPTSWLKRRTIGVKSGADPAVVHRRIMPLKPSSLVAAWLAGIVPSYRTACFRNAIRSRHDLSATTASPRFPNAAFAMPRKTRRCLFRYPPFLRSITRGTLTKSRSTPRIVTEVPTPIVPQKRQSAPRKKTPPLLLLTLLSLQQTGLNNHVRIASLAECNAALHAFPLPIFHSFFRFSQGF
jgi:hypothetical protein